MTRHPLAMTKEHNMYVGNIKDTCIVSMVGWREAGHCYTARQPGRDAGLRGVAGGVAGLKYIRKNLSDSTKPQAQTMLKFLSTGSTRSGRHERAATVYTAECVQLYWLGR